MTSRMWMTLPLLAALGCDPCPHNKCLGPPALMVRVLAADTGQSLVFADDDAGASRARATATVTQNGTTLTLDQSNPLVGTDALSTGVADGQATLSVSAPGYQTAQQALTVTATQCGGVIRQTVTVTLRPTGDAQQALTAVAPGGSTVCGEGE